MLCLMHEPFLPIYDLTNIPTDEELAAAALREVLVQGAGTLTTVVTTSPIWPFPQTKTVQQIFDEVRSKKTVPAGSFTIGELA